MLKREVFVGMLSDRWRRARSGLVGEATFLQRQGARTRKFSVVVAVALTLGLAGSAAADSTFHTEQLALHGVDGAPGGGMVVDAHANGPTIYSNELYTLTHALPGTYEVEATLYPGSQDCSTPLGTRQTAEITTNAVGNGQANATFTPEQVGPLRGSTLSIIWTVTGPATYVTDCTVVPLD